MPGGYTRACSTACSLSVHSAGTAACAAIPSALSVSMNADLTILITRLICHVIAPLTLGLSNASCWATGAPACGAALLSRMRRRPCRFHGWFRSRCPGDSDNRACARMAVSDMAWSRHCPKSARDSTWRCVSLPEDPIAERMLAAAVCLLREQRDSLEMQGIRASGAGSLTGSAPAQEVALGPPVASEGLCCRPATVPPGCAVCRCMGASSANGGVRRRSSDGRGTRVAPLTLGVWRGAGEAGLCCGVCQADRSSQAVQATGTRQNRYSCRQHGSGCRGLKQWPIPGSTKRSCSPAAGRVTGRGWRPGALANLGCDHMAPASCVDIWSVALLVMKQATNIESGLPSLIPFTKRQQPSLPEQPVPNRSTPWTAIM